jgi:hypothetical protein
MKPLLVFIFSNVLITGISSQEFRLISDYELDIPVENPYGLTWHEGYFWITDVKSGEILGFQPEQDNMDGRSVGFGNGTLL